MRSYFQVARKYLSDTDTTPVVHTPEYSRLVTYDWGNFTNGSANSYSVNFSYIRFYIKNDQHLAEHARQDGFDIHFTDLDGNALRFELVYYSNGTGEWWIFFPDIGTLLQTSNAHNLPLYNADNEIIYYFNICYGDVAKNTDPTTNIWRLNPYGVEDTASYEYQPKGLVAHTTYKKYEQYPDDVYDMGSLVYESANSNGRPINSFTFSGHAVGYTRLEQIAGVYDSNHILRDYRLGNPCSLVNIPLEDSPYPFAAEAAQAGYLRTPWLPLYNCDPHTGAYTTDGSVKSLLFAIKTAPYFSEYHAGTKTLYQELLAYKNIVITAEYNTSTGLWLRFSIDTGYHTTSNYYSIYSLSGGQTFTLDQDTGYVFLVSIRTGTYDNINNTDMRLLDVKGVSTASLNYVANYNTVEGPMQSSRYTGRVHYGTGICAPTERLSPYNDTEHYESHHLVNLLEVIAPTWNFPYRAYYPGDNETVIANVNSFVTNTRPHLNSICAMLFKNESIRTIASATGTTQQICIWNKSRIYQGLAGGCN